jgi:hypothetical protein
MNTITAARRAERHRVGRAAVAAQPRQTCPGRTVRPQRHRSRRVPETAAGPIGQARLTRAQTGKATQVPVVLAGVSHWRGLTDWISEHLATPEMIAEVDTARLRLTDDPAQIAAWVSAAWATQPRSLPPPPSHGTPPSTSQATSAHAPITNGNRT